jgi:outer membrane protein TolC
MMDRTRTLAWLILLLGFLSACAIHPRGEREERKRALEAGLAFEPEAAPEPLPDEPTSADYLRQAFYAGATLRQRYWEWRAALERIPQEASPPNLALNLSYLFNDDNLKAWDRATLFLSNDPMMNIPLTSKLDAAGRRALENARAAGLRFEAEKFRLQAEVLSLYLDLALHGELIRIQEGKVALLVRRKGEIEAAVRSGRRVTAELLDSQGELDWARNDLATLHAQVPPLAARMNTLLGRGPFAEVPLPRELPQPRPFTTSDAELIELAAERSPELAALALEVAGNEEALTLARLSRLPDINPIVSLTGGVSQTLGAMLILPTRLEAIRAAIEEAQAMLEAAQVAREQYARDLAASFVLNLLVLRNSERQLRLFDETFMPRATLAVDLAHASYAAGRAGLSEVVEPELAALEVRLARARLLVEREKALVAIETWSALDVEALHSALPGSMGR